MLIKWLTKKIKLIKINYKIKKLQSIKENLKIRIEESIDEMLSKKFNEKYIEKIKNKKPEVLNKVTNEISEIFFNRIDALIEVLNKKKENLK